MYVRTYVRTTSAVGGQRLTLTQQTLLRTLVQASFPKISHAAVISHKQDSVYVARYHFD